MSAGETLTPSEDSVRRVAGASRRLFKPVIISYRRVDRTCTGYVIIYSCERMRNRSVVRSYFYLFTPYLNIYITKCINNNLSRYCFIIILHAVLSWVACPNTQWFEYARIKIIYELFFYVFIYLFIFLSHRFI